MGGPLTGVVVVELAAIGAVPFAGMMLADMGAEVIRIDRPPVENQGSYEQAILHNGIFDRGRRSISLNLKSPAGVDAVLRLVEQADVLIEGYRPGVTERLGLGPDICLQRNPKLVYGRMTGWGQTGPLAQAAGHDINYIALSGALHAIGPGDGPPCPPLNLVGDFGGGGMLLTVGVIAALFEAGRSGAGQVVDAAMTDGSAVLMSMFYDLHARGLWQNRRESNLLDGGAPFYGVYTCKDGKHISIGPLERQFYQLLLEKCGIGEPEFRDQWSSATWPQLKARLKTHFMTRTRDEWCALLEGSEVCFAPVLSLEEAPRHPHNMARGTFVESRGLTQPAPAPRFSRTSSLLPEAPPATGQDTVEMLKRAGFGSAEIAMMIETGVAHAVGASPE